MLKSYLITFFISMVPIVELRGAIPYGTLLCNPPVPLLQAYIISIIGNMLPVPIIFFFARKVLEWGADKPIIGGFFTWYGFQEKHDLRYGRRSSCRYHHRSALRSRN